VRRRDHTSPPAQSNQRGACASARPRIPRVPAERRRPRAHSFQLDSTKKPFLGIAELANRHPDTLQPTLTFRASVGRTHRFERPGVQAAGQLARGTYTRELRPHRTLGRLGRRPVVSPACQGKDSVGAQRRRFNQAGAHRRREIAPIHQHLESGRRRYCPFLAVKERAALAPVSPDCRASRHGGALDATWVNTTIGPTRSG
jgi:hypothetical protein